MDDIETTWGESAVDRRARRRPHAHDERERPRVRDAVGDADRASPLLIGLPRLTLSAKNSKMKSCFTVCVAIIYITESKHNFHKCCVARDSTPHEKGKLLTVQPCKCKYGHGNAYCC